MKENFFEGKDFRKTEFKALMPEYYPRKYQKYILEESKLLSQKLRSKYHVLEAGVGIGRLIPQFAPAVKEFIGVDNANLMLKKSRAIAKKFPQVKIINGDLEELDTLFPEKYFDISLCVWNTLGNVKDEVRVLQEISQVTSKNIIITVYRKGTLKDRKDWYRTVGIKISKIDQKNEIFYSESGLRSKSYSLADIRRLAKASNLRIKDSKILAGVMLWVELTAIKDPKHQKTSITP